MQLNAGFQWKCEPQAEAIILDAVTRASRSSPAIAKLASDLLNQTSTRLFDWLDFVSLPDSESLCEELKNTGFVCQEEGLFTHPGAQLPRIALHSPLDFTIGLGVAVDSIADFLMVRGEKREIIGSEYGSFRRCTFSQEEGMILWVIERRGTFSITPTQEYSKTVYHHLSGLEKWMTRSRPLVDEERAMKETIELAKELVHDLGVNLAAWTVLEGERRYWQSRNTAGQIQKNRQDRLGMGWANHDHHTFRSSRKFFQSLVHLFEILGFSCRERFYAGQDAGWGAQVMENPVARLVLFLDVDLSPLEIEQDFAHEPFEILEDLGTIGLWCALHGDSILKGGMHHLEAQFMFEELKQDIGNHGIKMMEPFSSFPYLRQAFTVGENWSVDPLRIQLLLDQEKITQEQATRFATQGAIGSHLENLQRREGYKGFNQKNVSVIIKKTDPRLQKDCFF